MTGLGSETYRSIASFFFGEITIMFKMPVSFYEKALEITRGDLFEQGIVPF